MSIYVFDFVLWFALCFLLDFVHCLGCFFFKFRMVTNWGGGIPSTQVLGSSRKCVDHSIYNSMCDLSLIVLTLLFNLYLTAVLLKLANWLFLQSKSVSWWCVKYVLNIILEINLTCHKLANIFYHHVSGTRLLPTTF